MTRYKKGKKYSTSRYGPLQLAYDGICYMIAKHKKNTKKKPSIYTHMAQIW